MVLCRFFQQGNCRFGQYCKYEHSYGNRSKTFNEEESLALCVAKEVLHAEKGGQWLLSCYGPFKEKKSIPEMDDLSPEEVRWEMYQAQKNGTVDQISAHFQQMCAAMKAKREALKNPTPAIVQLLENLQGSGTENTGFGDTSKTNRGNFAFGASQLGLSNTNNSNNNQTSGGVFTQKTFGATSSNPFGGSSTFNSTASSSSIFGRTNTSNTTSVFGGKANFGGTSVFGGNTATAGSSIFGGTTKTTPFGSVQNAPTFGGLASQGTSSSIFGSTTATQSTFGQPPAFGAAQATANSFLKPPTVTQGSVFGTSATTANASVFGGTATAQPNGATNPVMFGQVATQPSAPVASGIFGQAVTQQSAFGGAPVFGGSAFGASSVPTNSVFGGQSTFGGASTGVGTSPSVFGGSATTGSSFGSLAAQGPTTNVFGGAAAAAPTGANAFEAAPNTAPFSTPISTAAAPFGAMSVTATPVFASSAPSPAAPFGTAMAPFSKPPTFGFATPATDTTSVFGVSTPPIATTQSTFGTASTFGQPNIFDNQAATNTTTTASNPFGAKSTPFGTAPANQASPFGNFAKSTSDTNVFGATVTVTLAIDETAYTPDNCLTDDEKAAYKLAQFIEGQIPLKPPSKELR